MFNGHGADHEVYGQDGEMLICSEDDSGLCKGRVVYVRACSAGNKFGKSVVDKGASAFIGYKESFVFITDPEMFRKPLEDEYAKPFLNASNQVVVSLLKRDLPRKAHNSGTHDSIFVRYTYDRKYSGQMVARGGYMEYWHTGKKSTVLSSANPTKAI